MVNCGRGLVGASTGVRDRARLQINGELKGLKRKDWKE